MTSKSGQKGKKTHEILGKSSLPLTTQHDKFFLLKIRAKRQSVSESVCQISTINNSRIIIVHAAPLTLVQVTNERRVHSSPWNFKSSTYLQLWEAFCWNWIGFFKVRGTYYVLHWGIGWQSWKQLLLKATIRKNCPPSKWNGSRHHRRQRTHWNFDYPCKIVLSVVLDILQRRKMSSFAAHIYWPFLFLFFFFFALGCLHGGRWICQHSNFSFFQLHLGPHFLCHQKSEGPMEWLSGAAQIRSLGATV